MTDHRVELPTGPSARRTRRRTLPLVLTAGALLLAAGCGEDSGEAAGAPGEYCDAAVAVDQAFQAVDADDPDSFASALATAQAALGTAAGVAPSAVREEYGVLEAALDEVVATGDPAPYFADEVVATEATVHGHDVDACDWTSISVSAEDYAFAADWPSKPGPVSFDVTNTGAEPHVLIVVRKLDSTSGSALDAFEAAASEEELVASFEFAASVFVAPGASDYALADLAAGDYVVFCPVPVGTTGEESIGDGPPHHRQGMLASFELA